MLRVVKWWEIDKLKIFFEILKVWVILSLMVAWIVFISKIHESMVIWSCNITFWRQIFGKTAFFLFFLLFWPKSSNINKCWVLWQILMQIFSWDPKVPGLQIYLLQNSFGFLYKSPSQRDRNKSRMPFYYGKKKIYMT